MMFWIHLAHAADPGAQLEGEYRLVASLPGEMAVDDDGTHIGQGFVLDQRLRLGAGWQARDWHLQTEWDFLDGQVAGDVWDIPGSEDERRRDALTSFSLDGIRARKLSVGTDSGKLRLDFGLMTSSWGLGLVANDGAGDPLFGRSDFGDRVLRFRAGTMPADQLRLVGAVDLVVADDTARLSEDQVAVQGIAALLAGTPATGVGGVYVVVRHQEEDAFAEDDVDRRSTDAGVLDLYGDLPLVKGAWTLRLAGEGAAIVGVTSRSLSYNSRQGLDLASGGVVGRLSLVAPEERMSAQLRAGWASGDGEPDDGVSQAFSFDRDFDVGMVLFDEVQGALDAAAYAQLTDPEYSGQAPDGADALVGEGALRGAVYLQPVLQVKPLRWAQLRAGLVVAWASAPIAQPFESFRNGGVPTNHLGEATSGRHLGTELDWALVLGDDAPLAFGAAAKLRVRPALVLQGGHAFLSEDLGGDRVDVLMALGRVRI